jgi:predicted amidophosphoribosyltransferase
LRTALGGLASELSAFFLPAACLGCGEHLPLERSSELVCIGCRSRLKEPSWPRCERCGFPRGSGDPSGLASSSSSSLSLGVPPSVDCLECRDWGAELVSARSAVELRPPAEELVYGLKYGGWAGSAALLGGRMVWYAIPPDLASGPYLVVPVPTTAKRLRSRGYNQAQLLAEAVSGGAGRPLLEALERRPGGPTQVGLHPAQRRANVKHAFVARNDALVGLFGARVLLVDDVLTTGSTAVAAARALVQAGTAQVFLTTFARACPYD